MAKENTLIYRVQTGDEGAFSELMRAYHAYVYAIVIGIVKNSHDAEEVVQDTFLSAYRGLTQLENRKKFKSWLAEIARNRARNWLRKQRGDTVSIDEVSEHLLQTEDSPDERLTRLEQRELIRRTMETLPQKDRDIARAFYLEGASYNELTSAHGLSDKAISFRLSRARRQLSKRLQYLLTGIFVSPGLTLKKIYSGGLTIMKVGTVPKITVGVAALIAVIFISFIGIRQMNAPQVEERVYLSPWEDGTARPQNSPEGLAAQTNSTQDTEVRDNPPQIASAVSAAGMESTDDFLGQPEETDTAQFAIEGESEPDIEQSLTTDTSTLLDDNGQSAEDVMYAFVEALRISDIEAILPLLTETLRNKEESGDLYEGSDRTTITDEDVERFEEIAADAGVTIGKIERIVVEETGDDSGFEQMLKVLGQTEVVSSEYASDEFHFQLRMPAPKIPEIPGVEHMPISMPDFLVKMRREDGMWLIYKYGWDR